MPRGSGVGGFIEPAICGAEIDVGRVAGNGSKGAGVASGRANGLPRGLRGCAGGKKKQSERRRSQQAERRVDFLRAGFQTKTPKAFAPASSATTMRRDAYTAGAFSRGSTLTAEICGFPCLKIQTWGTQIHRSVYKIMRSRCYNPKFNVRKAQRCAPAGSRSRKRLLTKKFTEERPRKPKADRVTGQPWQECGGTVLLCFCRLFHRWMEEPAGWFAAS